MTCDKCPKYNTCKSPCEDIEKQLRDEGIYSRNYIRPLMSKSVAKRDGKGKWREIPFSSLRKNINGENPIEFGE